MSIRTRRRLVSIAVSVLLVAAFVPVGQSVAAPVSAAVATPPVVLRSVVMLDTSVAFAAAIGGSIWRTANGGADWTQVRVADGYDLRGIDFWDSTDGVAVDYLGRVAHTTNGGLVWSNVNFYPYDDMDGDGASRTHNDVACAPTGDEAITAAGDDSPGDDIWTGATAMRSTGTLSFWRSPLGETTPHTYFNAADQTYYDVGKGELLDIEYVDDTTVWASGIDYWTLDGSNLAKYPLFSSTDGGVTWNEVGFGTAHLRLEGVAFGTATAGVVVGSLVGGSGRAYYTINGGTTWLQGTLPGTAVLNAVDMTDATHAWAVGAGGTVLRTTDGGATWTPCTIPAGFAADLYDVKMDGTSGIAVGEGAVLRTSDGITWTGAAVALEPADVVRIQGADRILTAIEASKVAFPSPAGAPVVVIATARNWPDALGGAALAGALGGPILLTEPGALPATVATEIDRLGATKAVILGGTAAVSAVVESSLDTLLGAANVDRIAGVDRYDTARRVAVSTVAELSDTFDGTVFVATGANFPDALAASPLAAAQGWPIYLVRPTGVDDALVASMNGIGVDHILILGGTSVVSSATDTALKSRVVATSYRLAGADRYATARVVATYGVTSAGLGWDHVALATGTNFPDALSGGVLQARADSVMLLTQPDALYDGARQTLEDNRMAITEARILGGTGAVSTAVETAARAALVW